MPLPAAPTARSPVDATPRRPSLPLDSANKPTTRMRLRSGRLLRSEVRAVPRAARRTGSAPSPTTCSSWFWRASDVRVKQRARASSPGAGATSGGSFPSSVSAASMSTHSRLPSPVSPALRSTSSTFELEHGHLHSLLRDAAHLAPENLIITLSQRPSSIFDAEELPCLHRTTSLRITAVDLCISPLLSGEFTALTSLLLHSCSVDLGALLPICPCLCVLELIDYWG
ncbi:hypothetical protein BAE44_0002003, partial [Dichanthelium oligosanthes]